MASKQGKKSKEKHLIPASFIVLNALGKVGQLTSVPYLPLAASLASQIAQTVQDVKDNKAAFQELAIDAASLVAGIWHSYEVSPNKEIWPPRGVRDVLVELESTLRSIQEYAEQKKERSLGQRIIQSKADPGKILEYRQKLALYVSKFEIHSHISINEGVSQIISSQRAADQAFLDAAAEKRASKAKEILSMRIASGASYDSAARADVPKCHPETREVIIAKIMAWVKNPEIHLFLWMYGPAGCGKTTIVGTIAEMCDKEGLLAASFFFSRSADDRPKEKTHFISTIVDQMCSSIPGMLEHVAMTIVNSDPRIFQKTLSKQMEHLIIGPLNEIANQEPSDVSSAESERLTAPRLIVVDGLDECDGSHSQVELLEVLATAVKQLTTPLIFLIASRPEHHIRSAFSGESISLQTRSMPLDNDYQADADIRKYLISRFQDIKKTHPAGADLPGNWPSKDDLDFILMKASGQFIYPSVVMNWVASSHRLPTRQLDEVLKLSPSTKPGTEMPFAPLDALYIHVLSLLDPDNLHKALEILRWMIFDDTAVSKTLSLADKLFSYRAGESRIALTGLNALLDFQTPSRGNYFCASDQVKLLESTMDGDESGNSEGIRLLDDIQHSKEESYKFNVEYIYFPEQNSAIPSPPTVEVALRFFHASFPDFLLDRSRSGKYFLDASYAHNSLARHWINYYSDNLNVPRHVDEKDGKLSMNAMGLTVLEITRTIISHCGSASLTNELQVDLFSLDLRKSLVVVESVPADMHWWSLMFLNLDFILWLENQTFPDVSNDLHGHHLRKMQAFLQSYWSKYPLAVRKHLPVAITFKLAVPVGDYDLTSSWIIDLICDIKEFDDPINVKLLSNVSSYIDSSAHRHVTRLPGSHEFCLEAIALLCQMLTDFQLPICRGYFVDERLYTELALLLVKIFLGASKDSRESPKRHETDVAVVLPWILSKASPDRELAILLRDFMLQINIESLPDISFFWLERQKYLPSIIERFCLANVLYVHESKIKFRDHAHPTEFDTTLRRWHCAICAIEEWEVDLSEDPVPERPVGLDMRPSFLLTRLISFLEVFRIQVWLVWLIEALRHLFVIRTGRP